jgi:hypothetical protein
MSAAYTGAAEARLRCGRSRVFQQLPTNAALHGTFESMVSGSQSVAPVCTCQESHHLIESSNVQLWYPLGTFSLSRTDWVGLNNLNRIWWSRAHRRRNTSMPSPPPSMARTSERSSTMTRASCCERTASHNVNAASLCTTMPSHSMSASSPIFSRCTSSRLPPSSAHSTKSTSRAINRSLQLCRVSR